MIWLNLNTTEWGPEVWERSKLASVIPTMEWKMMKTTWKTTSNTTWKKS
jgi:hypothetical protein